MLSRCVLAAAVFSFVFSVPSSVAAHEPAEKSRPGLIKRFFQSFLTDDVEASRGPHFGPFVPGVEVLSSGAGLAPMLHFWTPDIFGTSFDIHASGAYSMYRYQHYDFQAGLVPHHEEGLPLQERGTTAIFPLSDVEKTASVPGFNLYASARHRDYPREDYFGQGPRSLRDARTDFRLKDRLYEGVVRFKASRLSVMGRAGWLRTSIEPGLDSSFPNSDLAHNSADYLFASLGAWFEGRDEPRNAHRGFSLGVAASRFDDRNGSAFEFNRLSIDVREYLPLGSNRHVIALRQVVSLDRADTGSRVPFNLQSTLGGSQFLRSYSSSRFRDDKLLALAGEYRFEARAKAEVALIYEAGKVFPTMAGFNLRGLERSYGVGIRLKSPRKVRFRVDVLRSVEGTRVQVKLGPSF